MKKKLLLIVIAIIIGVCTSIIYELKTNELWIFGSEEVIEELSDEKTSILVINLDYYNPLVSSNVYIKDLSKLVFEGLTTVTEDLNYENCLAKIIEVQNDYKTYRIVLKSNIKFHNGNELTTDDVIYTINKIQSLGENSIYYYNVKNIESMKKVSSNELKITLKEIDNFFPSKLDFPILSELTYSNKDLYKYKEYNGTGKYKVVKMSDELWTLAYNEDYREKQIGNLKQIDVKFIFKVMQSFEALKSGDAEIVDTDTEVGAYGRSAFSNKRYNTGVFEILIFNLDSNMTSNQNVRQAILLAINRDNIIEEYLNGYGKAVVVPINPASYLYNSDLPTYSFNPEKAQDILTNMGYKLEGETRKKDNEELKINFLINSDKEYAKEKAEYIKSNLADIGITVNIIEKGTDKFNELFNSKEYDMVLADFALSAYPEFLYYFETGNKNNISNFSDEEYDYLVYMAKREIVESKLIEYFHRMQEILNAKLPMACLYTKTSTIYYNKSIQGEFKSNMNNVYFGIENLIKE